MGRSRGRLAKT